MWDLSSTKRAALLEVSVMRGNVPPAPQHPHMYVFRGVEEEDCYFPFLPSIRVYLCNSLCNSIPMS